MEELQRVKNRCQLTFKQLASIMWQSYGIIQMTALEIAQRSHRLKTVSVALSNLPKGFGNRIA